MSFKAWWYCMCTSRLSVWKSCLWIDISRNSTFKILINPCNHAENWRLLKLIILARCCGQRRSTWTAGISMRLTRSLTPRQTAEHGLPANDKRIFQRSFRSKVTKKGRENTLPICSFKIWIKVCEKEKQRDSHSGVLCFSIHIVVVLIILGSILFFFKCLYSSNQDRKHCRASLMTFFLDKKPPYSYWFPLE